tara:strand:- start:473 stop:988 length:516 start_codon:yes stop_codon:yes gene_type:complete
MSWFYSDNRNINFLREIKEHIRNEMRISMLDYKPWSFQIYQLQSYKIDSTFHSPNDTFSEFDLILEEMMDAIENEDNNAYVDAYARFHRASLNLNKAYEDLRSTANQLQEHIYEIDRISKRIDMLGNPIKDNNIGDYMLQTETNTRKRSDLKYKWRMNQQVVEDKVVENVE